MDIFGDILNFIEGLELLTWLADQTTLISLVTSGSWSLLRIFLRVFVSRKG